MGHLVCLCDYVAIGQFSRASEDRRRQTLDKGIESAATISRRVPSFMLGSAQLVTCCRFVRAVPMAEADAATAACPRTARPDEKENANRGGVLGPKSTKWLSWVVTLLETPVRRIARGIIPGKTTCGMCRPGAMAISVHQLPCVRRGKCRDATNRLSWPTNSERRWSEEMR